MRVLDAESREKQVQVHVPATAGRQEQVQEEQENIDQKSEVGNRRSEIGGRKSEIRRVQKVATSKSAANDLMKCGREMG